MQYGQLKATHPSYDAETWCDYDALYRGGKTFRARIGRFVCQNPNEPNELYAQRKREASYRSYVGPIVDYFAAMLMSAPLEIRAMSQSGEAVEPDEFYAKLKEDVDGVGTDLVDFSRSSFRSCLTKRACWWLASLPANQGRAPKTRAEWEDRQLGDAKLAKLEPECVLDWEHDEAGHLLWAIVYEESAPRLSPFASRSAVRMVWRIYDRQNVTTFEKVYDKTRDPSLTDETEIPQVSSVPHGFDRVPLVRVEVPDGLWLLDRVADAQREHFRLSSGLGWAIRRTCYAMPVFKMGDGDNGGPRAPMGVGFYILIGQNDSMEWAAPPAQPYDVVSAEVKAQKDEIYRVAQQMAQGVENNAAAIGRSGESKLADASATEVCLKAYGAVIREAIEKALDLVAEGRKDGIKFSVTGLDKFSLGDAKATVENATKATALNIPSRTLKQELFMSVAEALLPGADQMKKDAIRKEIESGVVDQEREAEEAKKALEDDMIGESKPGDAAETDEQDDEEDPPSERPES